MLGFMILLKKEVELDAKSLCSLFMDLPEYFIKFTFYVENKDLVIEWLNANSPTTKYKCESWHGIQKQEKEQIDQGRG